MPAHGDAVEFTQNRPGYELGGIVFDNDINVQPDASQVLNHQLGLGVENLALGGGGVPEVDPKSLGIAGLHQEPLSPLRVVAEIAGNFGRDIFAPRVQPP